MTLPDWVRLAVVGVVAVGLLWFALRRRSRFLPDDPGLRADADMYGCHPLDMVQEQDGRWYPTIVVRRHCPNDGVSMACTDPRHPSGVEYQCPQCERYWYRNPDGGLTWADERRPPTLAERASLFPHCPCPEET